MDKYIAMHNEDIPRRSAELNSGPILPLNEHQGQSQMLLTTQPETGTEPQLSVPQNYEWFADMLRNRPQVHSLRAAILLMISGGMYFSSIFHLSRNNAPGQTTWFPAVIGGGFVSALFMEKFSKRVYYLVASILVFVSGLLEIVLDRSLGAAIARYFTGMAFGLTLVATIVLGSEQSVKRFRGHVLGLEQFCLVIGMIADQYFTVIHGGFSSIFILFLAGLALYATFFNTVESPITYLRQRNETEATNALVRLQKPHIITAETQSLLNENKCLLEEDIARGSSVNYWNGLVPMLKVCVFRTIVAMSFGTLLLVPSERSIPLIFVCAAIRLVGVYIGHMGVLDSLGRKTVSVVVLVIGGVLLIVYGMSTSFELVIAYQLFAGLAAPASTCYLGEAFSVSVKAMFIAFAVAFENIILIIIFSAYCGSEKTLPGFGYTLGVIQIVVGIIFYYVMPETKNTTLREALALFGSKMNAGFHFV